MSQESESESLALTCTLDDSGDISHHKRLVVAICHNAKRGFESGEWIVGYLGACTRQSREQCRFTCIGESHQTDVSQEFQFENDGHLLHRLSRLGIAWSLIGGRAKLEVAKSSASALQQQHLLSVVGNVANILARLGIIHHRTARHIDIHVLAVGAMTLVATAIAAMLGKHMTLVFQVEQCPVVVVAAKIDASALTSVATIWTSVGIILHMPKVHASPSALSRAAIYLNVIYEIGFSHS